MLFILSVQGQLQPRQNHTCETDSYFLMTSHHQIRNLEDPVYDVEHCGQEWADFGTCCGLDNLLDQAKLETRRIDRATEKLISSIERYSRDFKELLKSSEEMGDGGREIEDANLRKVRGALEKLLKAKKSKSRKIRERAFSNFILRKKIDALSSKIMMVRRIAGNREAISFSANQLAAISNGEFRRKTEACWKGMKELRSSSYCSVCSSRAAVFFKEDKILIGENACNSIISQCEASFRMLFNFYTKFGTVSKDIIATLEGSKKEHDETRLVFSDSVEVDLFKKNMSKIHQISDEVQRGQIPQRIQAYLSASEQEKPLKAKPLCSRFVSLSKKTIIETLAERLTYKTGFMKELTAFVTAHMKAYLANKIRRIQGEQQISFPKRRRKIPSYKQKKKMAKVKKSRQHKQNKICHPNFKWHKSRTHQSAQSQKIHITRENRNKQRQTDSCRKIPAAFKERKFRKSSCSVNHHKLDSHKRASHLTHSKKFQQNNLCAPRIHPVTRPKRNVHTNSRHSKPAWQNKASQRQSANTSAKPVHQVRVRSCRRKLFEVFLKDSKVETPKSFFDSSPKIFKGDVVVVPEVNAKIDSSYSSHFGSIGSSGNEAMKVHLPLNITSKFP